MIGNRRHGYGQHPLRLLKFGVVFGDEQPRLFRLAAFRQANAHLQRTDRIQFAFGPFIIIGFVRFTR